MKEEEDFKPAFDEFFKELNTFMRGKDLEIAIPVMANQLAQAMYIKDKDQAFAIGYMTKVIEHTFENMPRIYGFDETKQ